MRTQTIYRAMTGAYRTIIFTQTVDDFLHRKARQWAKFERELLRRMDERDALVAPRPRFTTIADLEAFGRSIAVNVNAGDTAGGEK